MVTVNGNNLRETHSPAGVILELPPMENAGIVEAVDAVPGGVHLLSSNYSMPRIGFGTNKIRKRTEVVESLTGAIQAGHRCFDVSAANSNISEIGKALEQSLFKSNLNRSEIFLIATVGLTGAGSKRNIKSSICNQVADYLMHLKTDYIDLVVLNDHLLDQKVADNATEECRERRQLAWTEMERLKGERCIRSLGVCHFSVALLNEMKQYDHCQHHQPAVNQIERSDATDELLAYATANNIYLQISNAMCKPATTAHSPSAISSLLASMHTTAWPLVLMPVPYSSRRMGIILASQTDPEMIKANLKQAVNAGQPPSASIGL